MSTYREANEEFMAAKAAEEGVEHLGKGVYRRVIKAGDAGPDAKSVAAHSVVSCHYKGSLITGRVFDNSWERGCPEAFRVRSLIEGFQAALTKMHVGDHWEVYIPWNKGYGKRDSGPIPAYSALIFEIELINIA